MGYVEYWGLLHRSKYIYKLNSALGAPIARAAIKKKNSFKELDTLGGYLQTLLRSSSKLFFGIFWVISWTLFTNVSFWNGNIVLTPLNFIWQDNGKWIFKVIIFVSFVLYKLWSRLPFDVVCFFFFFFFFFFLLNTGKYADP